MIPLASPPAQRPPANRAASHRQFVSRRRRADAGRLADGPLRVAVVAETFLPNINGVTNSVLRTLEHLQANGHEALVIAPGPGCTEHDGVPVVRVRSFDMPGYADLRIGLPGARVTAALRGFAPDVVHLAAPTVLGAHAVRAARRLGIASVAIFQTDLAGFAKRNGMGRAADGIWNYLRWVHSSADRTLAPSRSAAWSLTARGVSDVHLWARGVDLVRFHPAHRSNELRRFLAPPDHTIVGFVGRLAKEKQVERLAAVCGLPGVHVVIVGDGPERAQLEARLPGARFVGFRTGPELSQLHASFDVFAHTGIDETFCQALQEAMASGVATVAPSAGGPLDLVRHGETGYFWSPEVPETLQGAVAELAGDPALRARMGTAARAAVERRPWNVIMEQLVGHYRAVALARAAGRAPDHASARSAA